MIDNLNLETLTELTSSTNIERLSLRVYRRLIGAVW